MFNNWKKTSWEVQDLNSYNSYKKKLQFSCNTHMKETRSSKQMSAKKGLGFQKQKWHMDLILLTDFYRKISLVKKQLFPLQ